MPVAFKPTPYVPSPNFYSIDERLQGLHTKIVYIGVVGPDGKRPVWDIWGPTAGAQGVIAMPGLSGMMHVPFNQLISEGPYQVGGQHERVDYRKRSIGLQVLIGAGQIDNIFRYRMVEQRWWASWSATEDGFLGVFTRTHGWRWLKVRMAEEPKDEFVLDPAAFGNNAMGWNMNMVAVQPYWTKKVAQSTWINDGTPGQIPHTPWDELEELVADILKGLIPGIDKLLPGVHVGEGNIVIPNRGDLPAWPKFLVSGPGRAWIEDGPGGRMVPLPLLSPKDGVVMVDTDPTARTLTATKDPIDPLFYRILRNSQFVDFFLHDELDSTLPIWRRFNDRFTTPWPAKKVNRIKVRHSNAKGKIVAFCPQRYSMAFGS